MVIGSPRNKMKQKNGEQNTNRPTNADQKLTIQLLTKLLDGYSPNIELKFSASLRFAVFLQILKSDKFIAKIRNSKTYLPSPSIPTVETLLNAAPEKFRWASHFG